MKYIITKALVVLIVVIIVGFYMTTSFFGFAIVCPFRLLTGYDCPGCGSQRALHYLLHFDVKKAFLLNPLLVVLLPYSIVFLIFRIKRLRLRFYLYYQWFFGFKTIVVILAFILIFGLLRNTEYYKIIISRL